MSMYIAYSRTLSWPGTDTRSGHYQVITTLMGDRLRTGKPSWYTTNTKVNSAFHPYGGR